jgi:hypothetical protein
MEMFSHIAAYYAEIEHRYNAAHCWDAAEDAGCDYQHYRDLMDCLKENENEH